MKPAIGKARKAAYAFTGEDGGKSWDKSVRTGKRKAKKLAKAEPFDQWLIARIPGRPKPAIGGYEPAEIVARLRLHEGNESFSRHFSAEKKHAPKWRLSEPKVAFGCWRLIDPEGGVRCVVEFWLSRDGRAFAIGQDVTGARWWLTPADPDHESPTLWLLKRQAPRSVTLSAETTGRGQ